MRIFGNFPTLLKESVSRGVRSFPAIGRVRFAGRTRSSVKMGKAARFGPCRGHFSSAGWITRKNLRRDTAQTGRRFFVINVAGMSDECHQSPAHLRNLRREKAEGASATMSQIASTTSEFPKSPNGKASRIPPHSAKAIMDGEPRRPRNMRSQKTGEPELLTWKQVVGVFFPLKNGRDRVQ